MNTKFTSPERPQLYGIVPGKSEAVSEDLDACDPHGLESLWPLLLQGGGVLPEESEVSFKIEFCSSTARVCFFWDDNLIVTAGVAWQPGDEAQYLWRWCCTSMNGTGCAPDYPLPSIPVWAVLAVPRAPLPASPEKIFQVYRFMAVLSPAIVAWTHLQN